MDTRITLGLGTAAVALLLLPLGYQLYTSTAITPLSTGPVVNRPVEAETRQQEAVTGLEASQNAAVGEQRLRDEADGSVVTLTEEVNGGNAQIPPAVTMELPKPDAAPQQPADLDTETGVLAQKSVAPNSSAIGRTTAAPMAAESAAGAMAPGDAMVGMPAPEPMMVAPTEPSGDVFTELTLRKHA